MRLLDLEQLSRELPVTLERLREQIIQCSSRQSAILRTVWLSECAAMINNVRQLVEAWMPDNDEVGQWIVKKRGITLEVMLFRHYEC